MRLTVDLDSLQLITSAGDRKRQSLLEFKRGDSTPLEVQFVRAGVAEALPEGAVLSFGLKASGKYDDDFAVFFDAFAEPTATPNFIYAGTPNFNTEALGELLEVDGDSANDKASVDLMGEFSWSVDEDPVSIRTFTVRIHNDVIRGGEAAPAPSQTQDQWLNARAVRYDQAQALTDTQQQRGRRNIGITKKGIRLIETYDPEEEDPPPPMEAAWKTLFVETPALYNGRKAYTPTGENFGENYTGKAAVVSTHPSDDDEYLVWIVADFEDGVLVPYSGWYDQTTPEEDPVPDDIWDVPAWAANGSDGDLASVESVEEVPTELLPTGAFVPLIDIASNVNDNAGLVMIGERLSLVLRHQTEDTWHELTIVDSGGSPTFSISDAL